MNEEKTAQIVEADCMVGWRLLEIGEVWQEGDEVQHDTGGWFNPEGMKCFTFAGYRVNGTKSIRRRVHPTGLVIRRERQIRRAWAKRQSETKRKPPNHKQMAFVALIRWL